MSARHDRMAAGQEVFLAFSGTADQPWLRLLRPGFRHCFAAVRDAGGWTVLEPLSGRLLVARLGVELASTCRASTCLLAEPVRLPSLPPAGGHDAPLARLRLRRAAGSPPRAASGPRA